MELKFSWAILVIAGTFMALNGLVIAENQHESSRRGKLFSLFNIVQFQNAPCVTSATIPSGGRRNGTCFTATECRSKGGSVRGACASGFGVCCLFTLTTNNGNSNQNCSYIQNPGYPMAYADNTALTYTINKCSPDVCFLRLDFESFTLQGTGNSADVTTAIDPTDATNTIAVPAPCLDQFNVAISSSRQFSPVPEICGENSGEHIFIDLSDNPTDSATLRFAFTGNSNTRNWDIKVTQYACNSENAPPIGCLQYHTELTGRMTTFNYNLMGGNHLPNHEYSICIRPENGYCCVQYQVCPDDDIDGFSLSLLDSNTVDPPTALQDDACADQDFIAISQSSSSCSQTPGQQLTNRYCGNFLNDIVSESHSPICDCTAPFSVDVRTNNVGDQGAPGLLLPSKGLCLDYAQIPCTG